MDNFIGYFRKVTTGKLNVTQQFQLAEKGFVVGTGKTFYVDSDASNASNSNHGRSWARPLATLDGAVNKCTEGQGDTIVLAESHSETYTTEGTKATLDVQGINIVALGSGSDRATITFSHADATWVISAANVILENILFVTGIDSVVTYATISGADCKMINCESRDAAAKEVIDAFTVEATASRLLVDGHKHIGDVATGDASESIFNLTDVDDWTIKNSSFMTLCGTGVIEIASTAENAVVDNCVFYVAGTSDLSLNVVDTDDDSTIAVRNCYDIEAKGKFSGGNDGSGFSVAGDDVGTINSKIGTIVNSGGTATLGGVLGDVANISVAERLVEGSKKTTIADATDIPNNAQAAEGLLATATNGAVLIEEIIWQRGATDLVGPSNYAFSTDNANGLTGASAPNGTAALATFNAAKTGILSIDGTVKQIPFVLESGKKLYIHGDNAATSAGGTSDFYIKYKRLASNAYLA
jgi:hypothetical protein